MEAWGPSTTGGNEADGGQRVAAPPAEGGAGTVDGARPDMQAETSGRQIIGYGLGDSTDAPLCFICLQEVTPGEENDAAVLRTLPCACKGSVGQVHLACFKKVSILELHPGIA